MDEKGSEYHEVRVRDLESGAVLPDLIEKAQGGIAWATDGASFFYTVLDEKHRPCKVYHHRIGDDPTGDRLIYEEHGPGLLPRPFQDRKPTVSW